MNSASSWVAKWTCRSLACKVWSRNLRLFIPLGNPPTPTPRSHAQDTQQHFLTPLIQCFFLKPRVALVFFFPRSSPNNTLRIPALHSLRVFIYLLILAGEGGCRCWFNELDHSDAISLHPGCIYSTCMHRTAPLTEPF